MLGSTPGEVLAAPPQICLIDLRQSEPLASTLFPGTVSAVVGTMVAEPGPPKGHCKANFCSGCWEELPIPCFCGAVGMCSPCVNVLSEGFVSRDGFAHAAAGTGTGVTADCGEQFGNDVAGALHRQMQTLTERRQMVGVREPLDPWLFLDKEELRYVRESCPNSAIAVDKFTPFLSFCQDHMTGVKEESVPEQGYDEEDDLDYDEMEELYQLAVREGPENPENQERRFQQLLEERKLFVSVRDV